MTTAMNFNRNVTYLCLICFAVQVTTGRRIKSTCDPGTYLSEYLGGSCAACPEVWTYCVNEADEDVKPCKQACGKVSSTSAPAPFTNWSNATNLSTKSTTVNLRTSSGTTGINYQNATTERERSSSNNDKLWLIILAVVLVVLATIFGIVLFLRCRRQKLYRPSRVDAGENRKESCSIQTHNDTVVTLPESDEDIERSHSSEMDLKETYF